MTLVCMIGPYPVKHSPLSFLVYHRTLLSHKIHFIYWMTLVYMIWPTKSKNPFIHWITLVYIVELFSVKKSPFIEWPSYRTFALNKKDPSPYQMNDPGMLWFLISYHNLQLWLSTSGISPHPKNGKCFFALHTGIVSSPSFIGAKTRLEWLIDFQQHVNSTNIMLCKGKIVFIVCL